MLSRLPKTLLLGCSTVVAFCVAVPTEPAFAEVTSHPLVIGCGVAYSGTPYGGDTDGAFFPTISLGVDRARFGVRAYFQHGHYTDYSPVGNVALTPVGIGLRAYPLAGTFRPYLEAIPTVVAAKWGPRSPLELVAAIQLGTGITAPLFPRVRADLSLIYLRSDGSERNVADGPTIHFSGLDQVLLRATFAVLVGH